MRRMNHTPIKEIATHVKKNLAMIMKNIVRFEITNITQVNT